MNIVRFWRIILARAKNGILRLVRIVCIQAEYLRKLLSDIEKLKELDVKAKTQLPMSRQQLMQFLVQQVVVHAADTGEVIIRLKYVILREKFFLYGSAVSMGFLPPQWEQSNSLPRLLLR